jgi:hypothetical protein
MKQDIFKTAQPLIINNLVERFKATFADTVAMDVNSLGSLYSKDIVFKDPIHEISGLANLKTYMSDLCGNLDACRFVYLDEVIGEGKAYIKWEMHFSHPSLKKGIHVVRGVSHIQFDSRIHYQEDVYDMGAMIYENVPVFGKVVSWLKQRLESS